MHTFGYSILYLEIDGSLSESKMKSVGSTVYCGIAYTDAALRPTISMSFEETWTDACITSGFIV